MLTADEQTQVLRKVDAMCREYVILSGGLRRKEKSPTVVRRRRQRLRAELADLLKEIG